MSSLLPKVAPATSSSTKRELSPVPTAVDDAGVEAPAPKRAKVEETIFTSSTDSSSAVALRETDVGITTYVSPELIGLEGGVIKQRFSDFHVFEVAPDGTVCHITNLGPTPSSEGGNGLAEQLAQLEAEEADTTGALRAEREAKQEAERKAKREAAEEEKKKEAEKSWAWKEAVDEEAEAKLNEIIGAEATSALKEMWEKGPPPPGQDNRGRGRGRGRGVRGGAAASGPARPQPSVMSAIVSSKEQRTAVHQLLRAIFEGRLSSEAIEAEAIKPVAAAAAAKSVEDAEDALANAAASDEVKKQEDGTRIRIQWSSNAGRTRQNKDPEVRKAEEAAQPPPYIHFIMQKTNRDNQDAINILGRSLNLGGNSGHFSKALNDLAFAGTKDKRASTVQRISLRRGRKTLDDVWRCVNGIGKEKDGPNGGRMGQRGGRGGRGRGGYAGAQGSGERKTLLDAMRSRGERGIRIAHLKYADKPLFLGDLAGNEFVITLRNVKVTSEDVIARSIDVLRTKGFINYFGMQRFGSSSVSTHHVGIFVFKRDFHSAVEGVMSPRAGDLEEADAGRQAYSEGRFEDALKLFPRGYTPERAVLEKMKRDLGPDGKHKNDWQNYFGNIPKMVRLMYLHAYQSCVWNKIASQRVVRFGLDAPIVGDVVSLDDFDGGAGEGDELAEDAEDDEEAAVAPSSDAPEKSKRSDKKKPPMRVHIVTEEDVAASKYSIHDVVIPIPGVSVKFAAGWMTELYESLLAEDGLTPAHINDNKLPEYTLHGAYRKLLHVPRNISHQLIRYSDTNINLAQTDEDKLLNLDVPPTSDPDAPFQALQLRFTLGTAAYATMALREILKQDTGTANQKLQTEMGEDRRRFVAPIAGGSLKDVNQVKGAKIRSWGAPTAPEPAASGADVKMESAETADAAAAAEPASTSTTNAPAAPVVAAEVSSAFKREMEKLRAEHAAQNGTPLDPEEAEEAAYNAAQGL